MFNRGGVIAFLLSAVVQNWLRYSISSFQCRGPRIRRSWTTAPFLLLRQSFIIQVSSLTPNLQLARNTSLLIVRRGQFIFLYPASIQYAWRQNIRRYSPTVGHWFHCSPPAKSRQRSRGKPGDELNVGSRLQNEVSFPTVLANYRAICSTQSCRFPWKLAPISLQPSCFHAHTYVDLSQQRLANRDARLISVFRSATSFVFA